MAQSIAVRYFDSVEREIAHGPNLRQELQGICDDVARRAAARAPRGPLPLDRGRQRHGADTIQGQVRAVPDGWEGRISWTKDQFHMYFHERGWVHKAARPFLLPALTERRVSS